MTVTRLYNGAPVTEGQFRKLDIAENPEVRAIYSAVLARLERESGQHLPVENRGAQR